MTALSIPRPRGLRRAAALLATAACLAGAPAFAQDAAPSTVETEAAAAGLVPPHNNVEVFRDVRRGQEQSITFQAPPDRVLIQAEGEDWRQLRNGPITQWGGWLLVVVFLAIAAFYAIRGKIRLEGERSGVVIQRFTPLERLAHWVLAFTFVVLAVSGLTMLFGKHLLIPVIGHTVFGWLAWAAKNLHNFTGPLFLASTLLMIALFTRDNIWQEGDGTWIRKAGGLMSGEHVPSWRFNFGEKTWFWIGVVVLGLLVGGTGLVLDFANFGQTRQNLQLAHVLHASGALLFMALSIGHIYIGSIGMEGALDSMKTGYVDETWAKEHHEYWYREAKRKSMPGYGAAPGRAAGEAAPASRTPSPTL